MLTERAASSTLRCVRMPSRGCSGGGIDADWLAPRRVDELMFPLAAQWVDRVVLRHRPRNPRRPGNALQHAACRRRAGRAAVFAAKCRGGFPRSEFRPAVCGQNRIRGKVKRYGNGELPRSPHYEGADVPIRSPEPVRCGAFADHRNLGSVHRPKTFRLPIRACSVGGVAWPAPVPCAPSRQE
jgi:hypothetical protein